MEGFELEVLNGNDWARFRPTVVLVEATRGEQLVEEMGSNGYRLEFFDGLNYYFVDGASVGVSIHNYSERVLRSRVRTSIEVDLANSSESYLAAIGGLGIRGHAAGLCRALLRRASARR